MKEPFSHLGRINEHANGAGVPSPEDVEHRARELAVIAGRAASDFTEADLAEAKRELLGGEAPPSDVNAIADSVIERDEVYGSSGLRAKTYRPDDEANIAQDLVEEGVEE